MALARTDRGTASLAFTGATPITTITSGAFTPAANSLIVVMYVGLAFSTTWTVTASSTHAGIGTWSYVDAHIIAFTDYRMRCTIAYAQVGGSPGSGTVSMAREAGEIDFGAAMSIEEISGHNTTTPVRQSDTETGAGVTTLTTTLTSTPRADSIVYAQAGDLFGTIGDPSGYTLLDALAVGDLSCHNVYDTASASQSQVWTGFNADFSVATAVEVQTPQTTVTPSVVARSVTMYSPTVSDSTASTPSVVALSATMYAPTVLTPSDALPDLLEVNVTAYLPTISTSAAVAVKVKVDGSWIYPLTIQIKEDGIWTEALAVKVKQGGVWVDL